MATCEKVSGQGGTKNPRIGKHCALWDRRKGEGKGFGKAVEEDGRWGGEVEVVEQGG